MLSPSWNTLADGLCGHFFVVIVDKDPFLSPDRPARTVRVVGHPLVEDRPTEVVGRGRLPGHELLVVDRIQREQVRRSLDLRRYESGSVEATRPVLRVIVGVLERVPEASSSLPAPIVSRSGLYSWSCCIIAIVLG